MLRFLKPKDKSNFLYFCTRFNSDFYILENGKKVYLTDVKAALKVFNSCMKHGNTCVISEDQGEILGAALVLRDSTTKERECKLLAKTPKVGEFLIQYIIWHFKKDFSLLIKKSNFLYRLCSERKYKFDDRKNFGFKFLKVYNNVYFYKYVPNLVREKQYNFKDND